MIKNINQFSGNKYNRITLLNFLYRNEKSIPIFECQCDCGKIFKANYYSVIYGNTKSCGCYRSEYVTKKNTVHGLSKCKIYPIWKTMYQRCYNANNKDYKYYGELGIKMSNTWKNDFKAFYDDMYVSYLDHVNKFGVNNTSLDRIDPNDNYCKENCRWATWKEQNNYSHKRKLKKIIPR